jgi:hypothetical protein
VTSDVFEELSRDELIGWAEEIEPGYKLKNWQYKLLIGEPWIDHIKAEHEVYPIRGRILSAI